MLQSCPRSGSRRGDRTPLHGAQTLWRQSLVYGPLPASGPRGPDALVLHLPWRDRRQMVVLWVRPRRRRDRPGVSLRRLRRAVGGDDLPGRGLRRGATPTAPVLAPVARTPATH